MTRTIDDYMKLPYQMQIVQDPDEGGYVVSFSELRGCLTCADTLEEAMANAEDAKRAWFTAQLEEGQPIPEPDIFDDYSGQFKLRLPKSLHKQLALQARREGISMNQLCLYWLSEKAGATI